MMTVRLVEKICLKNISSAFISIYKYIQLQLYIMQLSVIYSVNKKKLRTFLSSCGDKGK